MHRTMLASAVVMLGLLGLAGAACAQGWNKEQQEVWAVEQEQWRRSAAEDATWIDAMVHDNLRYWETGDPMPRDKASLARWNRYSTAAGATLEQELFPISITITGNVAVVQYHYMVAREDYRKERKTSTGQYTDVLIKENGKWLFLAWTGGDNPAD